MAEYRQLCVFLSELSKIFDLSLSMFFYYYVRRMLEFKGKLAQWLDRYIFILLIPFIVMIMANSFVPINFVVNEEGVCKLMPLYFLIDAIMNFDIYEQLEEISCPIFVLGAGKDKVLGEKAAKDIIEKLHCDYYIYEDSYNGVYDEAPDYRQRIKEFLDR